MDITTIDKLQANKQTLQADQNAVKTVSFGAKSNTKNFIEEVPKSTEFGLIIKNETEVDVSIAFTAGSGIFSIPNRTQTFTPAHFMDESTIKRRVRAHAFLADGIVYQHPETGDGYVTVTTKDPKRKVSELTKFAGKNPFRFTKFVMSSFKNDGTPESTNYNNRLKALWASPFEDTVEQDFSLRSIVRDKFQINLLEIDFQKDAPNLKAIISDEHVFVLTINAGTTLRIDSYVGARMSQAQHLYRLTNKVDDLVRPLRS